jgi:serine phosphatase RsbU (regulator of sigma subunit)
VAGEAFGNARLEQVLVQHSSLVAAELSQRILTEIASWRRASDPQDDMTLLVIDVA